MSMSDQVRYIILIFLRKLRNVLIIILSLSRNYKMQQRYIVYVEYNSGAIELFHVDLTYNEHETLKEMYIDQQRNNRLKIFRILNLGLN